MVILWFCGCEEVREGIRNRNTWQGCDRMGGKECTYLCNLREGLRRHCLLCYSCLGSSCCLGGRSGFYLEMLGRVGAEFVHPCDSIEKAGCFVFRLILFWGVTPLRRYVVISVHVHVHVLVHGAIAILPHG